MAEKARGIGKKFFFVPYGIANQASFISGIRIVACKSLVETVKVLTGGEKI
ncbi:unnamed protein product, partial [marine sediment metagenome]